MRWPMVKLRSGEGEVVSDSITLLLPLIIKWVSNVSAVFKKEICWVGNK